MARSGMGVLCGAGMSSATEGRNTPNHPASGRTAGSKMRIARASSLPVVIWQVHLAVSQQSQCAPPPMVRHIGQLQVCCAGLPRASQCRGKARKDHAHNRMASSLTALRRNCFKLPPLRAGNGIGRRRRSRYGSLPRVLPPFREYLHHPFEHTRALESRCKNTHLGMGITTYMPAWVRRAPVAAARPFIEDRNSWAPGFRRVPGQPREGRQDSSRRQAAERRRPRSGRKRK